MIRDINSLQYNPNNNKSSINTKQSRNGAIISLNITDSNNTLKQKSISPRVSSSSVPNLRNVNSHIVTNDINLTPNFTTDSTSILCRGRNSIGTQTSPCRINLRQAEIPPVSLLTSVAAESPKSRLNCSGTEEERSVRVVCPIDEETQRTYDTFILSVWQNTSLVRNVTR